MREDIIGGRKMGQIIFKENGYNDKGIQYPDEILTLEGFHDPLSVEEIIGYLRGTANQIEQDLKEVEK